VITTNNERFSGICKRIGIHQTKQRLYYQWLRGEFKYGLQFIKKQEFALPSIFLPPPIDRRWTAILNKISYVLAIGGQCRQVCFAGNHAVWIPTIAAGVNAFSAALIVAPVIIMVAIAVAPPEATTLIWTVVPATVASTIAGVVPIDWRTVGVHALTVSPIVTKPAVAPLVVVTLTMGQQQTLSCISS
jgi:hypothetical protein